MGVPQVSNSSMLAFSAHQPSTWLFVELLVSGVDFDMCCTCGASSVEFVLFLNFCAPRASNPRMCCMFLCIGCRLNQTRKNHMIKPVAQAGPTICFRLPGSSTNITTHTSDTTRTTNAAKICMFQYRAN
jgi:hypothetical protein